MTGKEKCRMLKNIRLRIAQENEIDFHPVDCNHTGPCAGTCPYCERETAQLEEALNRRASLGKKIVLAGLCAGLVVATSGCSMIEEVVNQPMTGVVGPSISFDAPKDEVVKPTPFPTDSVDEIFLGIFPAPDAPVLGRKGEASDPFFPPYPPEDEINGMIAPVDDPFDPLNLFKPFDPLNPFDVPDGTDEPDDTDFFFPKEL